MLAFSKSLLFSTELRPLGVDLTQQYLQIFNFVEHYTIYSYHSTKKLPVGPILFTKIGLTSRDGIFHTGLTHMKGIWRRGEKRSAAKTGRSVEGWLVGWGYDVIE